MTSLKRPLRVVQCWDDGIVNDIRLIEILRRHGARASFNLNPGQHGSVRQEVWRYKDTFPVDRLTWKELPSLYEGFTIANHTLNHPWASRIKTEEWRYEVTEGRRRLQDHFGQPVLGFAYPFGDRTEETGSIVADTGHLYARTCGKVTPCFPPRDPMDFAPDCHQSDPLFWTRYEQAKQEPGGVFYFWGHSYEFTNEEEWEAFENKVSRITADPDGVWTDLPELFLPSP